LGKQAHADVHLVKATLTLPRSTAARHMLRAKRDKESR
jgi:hypothetical protein